MHQLQALVPAPDEGRAADGPGKSDRAGPARDTVVRKVDPVVEGIDAQEVAAVRQERRRGNRRVVVETANIGAKVTLAKEALFGRFRIEVHDDRIVHRAAEFEAAPGDDLVGPLDKALRSPVTPRGLAHRRQHDHPGQGRNSGSRCPAVHSALLPAWRSRFGLTGFGLTRCRSPGSSMPAAPALIVNIASASNVSPKESSPKR